MIISASTVHWAVPTARTTAPVLSAIISIFFRMEEFAHLVAMILGLNVSSVTKISAPIVWLATICKKETANHVLRTAASAILQVSAWIASMDYS